MRLTVVATACGVLAFCASAFAQPISFSAAASLPVGANPLAIASADLNADGKLDLAVANFNSGNVSILLGAGGGTFAPAMSCCAATNARALFVADFDEDGKLDLAIVRGGANVLTIMLGNGDGTFTAGGSTGVAIGGGTGIAGGDFNHDGHADVAVTLSIEGKIWMLPGLGNGSFGPPSVILIASGPGDIASADLNKDGHLDLAVVSTGGGPVSILIGNGAGSFVLGNTYAAGTTPISVSAADVNEDGNVDLIVANFFNPESTVSILTGAGDGSFTSTTLGGFNSPFDVAVVDLNGDGHVDLAVSNTVAVTALAGDGSGAFSAPVSFAVGLAAHELVAADFNADGRSDLAVVAAIPGAVSMLLNNGLRTMAGFFTPAMLPSGGAGQLAISIAEINGDGAADLVVTNGTTNDASILLGDGAGAFAAAPNVPLGSNPRSTRVADLNLDGTPDILGPSASQGRVFIRLGVGGGAFDPSPAQDVINIGGVGLSEGFAVGDFNQDGKPDFVANSQSTIRVRLGLGNGSFITPLADSYASGGFNTVAVEAADLDFDGDLDLVLANSSGICTLLGGGDGSFAPPLCLAGNANGIAVGDVNHDGKPDVAIVAAQASHVSIRLGDGAGGFGAAMSYTAVASTDVAIADLNLDGRPDVVLLSNSIVQVMLGDGTGSFGPTATYGVSGGGQAIAVGNLSGTAAKELAVASSSFANEVTLMFNALADQDADGIADEIDKNLVSAADESAVPSNDFKDVATLGSIAERGGWIVGVGNLTPGGVQAAIEGNGSVPAIIESCPGGTGPEQVWLDTVAERAKISCNPNVTTATALLALPEIELKKVVNGSLTVVGVLDKMAHTASVGSPMTAGDDNRGPLLVKYLGPGSVTIGSFSLDPGESADTRSSDSGVISVEVLRGTVTFNIGGQMTTLGSGQSWMFLAAAPAVGISSATIAQLVAAGDVRNTGIANSLSANLEHAARQLGNDGPAAGASLRALRQKVAAFVKGGQLTAAAGATLAGAVDALLAGSM